MVTARAVQPYMGVKPGAHHVMWRAYPMCFGHNRRVGLPPTPQSRQPAPNASQHACAAVTVLTLLNAVASSPRV